MPTYTLVDDEALASIGDDVVVVAITEDPLSDEGPRASVMTKGEIKADDLAASEALYIASALGPVVVSMDDGVTWQDDWGALVSPAA